MSRLPIVAGNWKMNTTLAEGADLAAAVVAAVGGITGVETVICPPFISLGAASERLAGTTIALGAQNMHFEQRGAFTGEVSPPMLRGLCRYVIVGHSERRQYFGETDAGVGRKVKAALEHGLRPIVCVGEDLRQNESGHTAAVVEKQVRGALEGVAPTGEIVIAYEPVWAIGTGRAATAEGANVVIRRIRQIVAAVWDDASARDVRIQYGGSVTAANAAELFAQPEIDGALVGGASLKAADFAAIVRSAAL